MDYVDAIRPLTDIKTTACEGIKYTQLSKEDAVKVRAMRELLVAHLGESPCFMRYSQEHMQNWFAHVESRDSRLFVAIKEEPN